MAIGRLTWVYDGGAIALPDTVERFFAQKAFCFANPSAPPPTLRLAPRWDGLPARWYCCPVCDFTVQLGERLPPGVSVPGDLGGEIAFGRYVLHECPDGETREALLSNPARAIEQGLRALDSLPVPSPRLRRMRLDAENADKALKILAGGQLCSKCRSVSHPDNSYCHNCGHLFRPERTETAQRAALTVHQLREQVRSLRSSWMSRADNETRSQALAACDALAELADYLEKRIEHDPSRPR